VGIEQEGISGETKSSGGRGARGEEETAMQKEGEKKEISLPPA